MSVAHQTNQNSNRPFNSEAIQRSGGESAVVPPENEGFTKKQKKIIAGIAISSLLTGGAIAGKIFGEAKTVPAHPNAAVTDTVNPTETQKAPAIPNEAKQFVSEVGGRYADPVSTYYSVEAYKKENNSKTPIMTDEFINNYNFNSAQYSVSNLGFNKYSLQLDRDLNQDTSVEVFNNFTKPSLDLYANLLAKNPSQKAREIIDKEFLDYCSDSDQAFTEDDGAVKKMMETVKSIVYAHSSAANFNIAPASLSPNNPSMTLFRKSDYAMVGNLTWNGQHLKNYTEGGVNIIVNVDEYSGKNISKTKDTIKDVSLSFWEQPITGPLAKAKSTNISIGIN